MTQPPAPQPAQPGFAPSYPAAPAPAAPPRGFSGLAIAGVILAIFVPFVGFILSLIAIFQTGATKKRGRGLAITGVVLSVVVMASAGAVIYSLSKSTVIDPGCTAGKAAIFKLDANATPATLDTAIAELNAAADKAKNDDVRKAMKTLADDYTKLMADAKAGKAPDNVAMQRITADGQAIDDLCTIGS
ncbi:DUF4190 domain-containing protein [Actinoplanes sp. NPDC048988]|uniref:DUF4190 domain-containing protein n=1 Tax=Actinoplanes sp. NPDC048988 TaxID=3363901 RepID=UPI00370F812F